MSGAPFQANFKTNSSSDGLVVCDEEIDHIFVSSLHSNYTKYLINWFGYFKMSTFEFVHKRFTSTSEHIDGMNKVYEIIDNLKFSDGVFPTTIEYANWETDAVRLIAFG